MGEHSDTPPAPAVWSADAVTRLLDELDGWAMRHVIAYIAGADPRLFAQALLSATRKQVPQ